ncbi:MAG: hypothetical protein K8S22_06415, partial [Betaproteobacteria bacterium]|nr:hypothetical protein [Betaproteobacteria bacterium]
ATPNSTTAPAQHPQKIAIATSPMQGGPVSPASNPTHATASTLASEWAPRLALLEKNLGQLTFSKAIAILLDISSGSDLSLILTHESEVKRKTWHSFYAIGTDSKGNLVWGGAYQFRSSTEAAQTARDQCASGPGASCKVVMANGEFLEKDFVDMAKRLGGQSVTAVRQSFLQRLGKPAAESIVGIGGPSNSYLSHAMGYSSPRD